MTIAVTKEEWIAIGRRIAARREAMGMTQAQLAAAVVDLERSSGAAEIGRACSTAMIAHMEAGRYGISVSRLCAVAEALGTDAQVLLDGVL